MNKRFILFIGLSFLVILIWSKKAPNTYRLARQEVTTKKSNSEPSTFSLNIALNEPVTENLVSVVSNNRELIFSLPSACLTEVNFLEFGYYPFNLKQGFCLADDDLFFTQKKFDSKEAIFVHEDANKKITKHFQYSESSLAITLDIEVENLSGHALSYSSGLSVGSLDIGSRSYDSRFKEIFLKQQDTILRLSPSKELKQEQSGDFFGFRDRYFCAIIIPVNSPGVFRVNRVNNSTSTLGLSLPAINLLPLQVEDFQYNIYIGPQKTELLKLFHLGAQEIIYYGFFDPIAKFLMNILRLLFHLIHNWGFAIIILSIAIFFVLFPLSIKQMRSMKEMQHLQPQIEELRRLYKDNPQRLNKETLGLYRKNKINPFGGCLPMFLQIPIFFALFQALMRSIELKGANFLWIKDLSLPDRLVTSPEVNILPVLMAISMFLQQKSTLMPTGGSANEQQRLMSIIFPIMFGVFFYRMPSGLVLYWFINSLLMFIFQKKTRLHSEAIKH